MTPHIPHVPELPVSAVYLFIRPLNSDMFPHLLHHTCFFTSLHDAFGPFQL